jgi:CHAD domain-containing protein
MSYRLNDHETIPDGIKRIVVEEIDKALDRMQARSMNQDDVIHDVRVCLKKIRAVLRLVQPVIDGDVFRQELVCYRDAGRRLSAVRDTAAMLETFDKLTHRFADQLAEDAFLELRKPLRQSGRARQQEKQKALSEVAKTLREARSRVPSWPLQHDGFSAVHQGLKLVYKRGRQSFTNAFDHPSVESFHEWRKHVKCLWYQIRILKPIWPTMMQRLADELETLGEYLSDDHDLALLRQRVLEQTEHSSDRTDLEALVALIDQRRGELQVEARHLGERVYVEKPRAFIARLKVYWQAWRAETDVDAIAVS